MSKMTEVFVPDIGDFDAVEVIEILVSEGDSISIEDSLLTVESDKATMEIPSSHAGVVAKIKVNIGDEVSEGSLVVLLDAEQSVVEPVAEVVKEVPPPPVVEVVPVKEEPKAPISRPSPTINIDHDNFKKAHASPAVRKFARELGADLTKINGSGNHARILKSNVQD